MKSSNNVKLPCTPYSGRLYRVVSQGVHHLSLIHIFSLREVMLLLRKVIFPGFFGSEQEAQVDSIQYYTGVYLEQIYDLLHEQIYNGLCFEVDRCCDSKDRASRIAIDFINKIPHIKYLLSTDVKAILDGDPAAKSLSEIIFCYPAVHAILHQRVAHELLKLGVPVLPRIITEMALSLIYI